MLLKPQPLHIPDGFLSFPVSAVFWIITILILAVAVRKTQRSLEDRMIPLMGVMAAFIFAAQMINFPVAGGTSGHFLGGTLAAVVLGPWAGILVMTSVVIIQALLFQDGGLLVMGANILNMGILTSVIGYGIYQLGKNRPRWIQIGVIGTAGWLSVIAGALGTALQLWLSGTSPIELVFPAMLSVHVLIGIGEGLITIAAILFIHKVRPDILGNSAESSFSWGWAASGLLISAGVVFLAPFASSNPDGLEKVAENLNFIQTASEAPVNVLADYAVPFIENGAISTIAAGLAGILVVFAAVFLVRVLRTNRAEPK